MEEQGSFIKHYYGMDMLHIVFSVRQGNSFRLLEALRGPIEAPTHLSLEEGVRLMPVSPTSSLPQGEGGSTKP